MMKATVATVAALAVASSVQAETYYQYMAEFPADAKTGACKDFTLNAVEDKFASYLTPNAGVTPAPDAAACVTAAELNPLATGAVACIDVDNDTVKYGTNAWCPIKEGDACNLTATTNNVCEFESRCATDGTNPTCTKLTNVWTFVVKSGTDSFQATADADPAAVATQAWTAAVQSIAECKNQGVVGPAASFISNKNLKELTLLETTTAACNAKFADAKKAFEDKLKAASTAEEGKPALNQLTLASGKTEAIATIEKCQEPESVEYGCRTIKDCTAIACDYGEPCTENKQCGTNSCKKNPDDEKQTLCSGSAVTSAVFAVGAAALAAIALF